MSFLIAIADDDAAVRSSLSAVLATYGFDTRTHASAREALAALATASCDCMLLDVRMPDLDGITALKMIQSAASPPPVIIITGHADVAMAVQAMKLGAVDFIEKPIIDEQLVESIKAALERAKRETAQSPLVKTVRERYATLTQREQVVAGLVVEGYASAAIAAKLNISNRTVDHHRAAILAKMQATSLPQLLRYLLLVTQEKPEA